MAWIQVSPDVYRHTTKPYTAQLVGSEWLIYQGADFGNPLLVMPSDLPPPLAGGAGNGVGYLAASWSRSGADVTLRAGSRFSAQSSPVTILADQTVTMTGAAGWYFLTHGGGALPLTFEKVQASEIVADTERYSPTPAFSAADAQYYSVLASSKRILGALYWDGVSVISHFYAYGNGAVKNDSRVLVLGSQAVSSSGRARFGSTPTYQHGDDVLTWADDATNGTRLTVQRPGFLTATVTGYQGSGSNQPAIISRNQVAPSMNDIPNLAQKAFGSNTSEFLTGAAVVQPGDVIGFYLGGGAALANVAEAKLIVRLQELPC